MAVMREVTCAELDTVEGGDFWSSLWSSYDWNNPWANGYSMIGEFNDAGGWVNYYDPYGSYFGSAWSSAWW